MVDTRRTPTLRARFEAKVLMLGPEDCWPWTGKRHEDGYGLIRRGGRVTGNEYAHRLAYEFEHGPIPDEMTVDHQCVNPPCCNPRHLKLETLEDNSGLAKRRWTHCSRGHEFTPENTYWRPEGRRQCRACRRLRRRG